MTNAVRQETDDERPEAMAAFEYALRRYVAAVAGALSVGPESCAVDPRSPATLYVALDEKLDRFPDRELALLWDERFGWSAAVETYSNEDLIVVAYCGGELVPAPATVVAFVTALMAGRRTGQPEPPGEHTATRDELADLLAEYTR